MYLFVYILPYPHFLPAFNLPLFTILAVETTTEVLKKLLLIVMEGASASKRGIMRYAILYKEPTRCNFGSIVY